MIKIIFSTFIACQLIYAASTPDRKTNRTTYRMPLISYGGEAGDAQFQKYSPLVIDGIVRRIKDGKSFNEIMTYAGNARQSIAEFTSTPSADLFGEPRDGALKNHIDVTALRKFPWMMSEVRKLCQSLRNTTEPTAWISHSSINPTRVRLREKKLSEMHQMLEVEESTSQTPSFAKTLTANALDNTIFLLKHLSLAPTPEESDYNFAVSQTMAQMGNDRQLQNYTLVSRDDNNNIVVASTNPRTQSTQLAPIYFPNFPDGILKLALIDAAFIEVQTLFGEQWLPTVSFMCFTTNQDFSNCSATLLHPSLGRLDKSGSFKNHQQYSSSLFERLRNQSSRNIGTLAHWFYWSSRTMPWKRGSAAINGWILSGMLQADGHELNLPSKMFRMLDEMAQTSLIFEAFLPSFTKIISEGLPLQGPIIAELD